MIKRILFAALVVAIVAVVSFLTRKAPVDPAVYEPPPKPGMVGVLEPNNALKRAELLALGKIVGPEDVDVDNRGRVYGGTQDGKIIRIRTDGELEVFAETGGRPLGLHFDRKGHLIVCDAVKGLLSIDSNGAITVLATEADGVPFMFTDDLDIAQDGTIFFSDASHKYGSDDYLYDLLEARPHGRLLRFNPSVGRAEVLLQNLYFANGVALSQNEDFVLVNETYRYRIIRYWLKGPRAGTHDVFIDNLPGFPDGVSANRKGTFWVALFTVRNDIMDRLHANPFLKAQMSKLPRIFWPTPLPYGIVLALDESGNILQSLHEPSGEHLKEITSAQEHLGYLYLGSLHSDRIGKYKLPQ